MDSGLLDFGLGSGRTEREETSSLLADRLFFSYLTPLPDNQPSPQKTRRLITRCHSELDLSESEAQPPSPRLITRCHTIPNLSESRYRAVHAPSLKSPHTDLIYSGLGAPPLSPRLIRPRFRRSAILFILYMIVGSTCFYFLDDQMAGTKTSPILDSLYFTVVTMTTGYGDLEPDSVATKLLACFFVFVSMAAIALYLSQATDVIVEKQEALIVKAITGLYNKGNETELMEAIESNKGKYKFYFTTAFLLMLIIIGTMFLWKVEGVDLLDSFYCVWGTVTILGYGGKSFSSTGGRVFAVFWVIITTVCVAQFFFYLVELTAELEQKRWARWALDRKPTVADFLDADIDNDGQVSASEFILYKLKEMGKITEQDTAVILKDFENYDVNNVGKFTLSDIIIHEAS